MKLRGILTAVLLALALVASACTSNSATRPQTSSTASGSSGPTSQSSPVAHSSVAPTDPAVREVSDRQAVESAWVGFWRVYAGLFRIPKGLESQTVAAVAVDPVRKQMLAEIDVFNSTHRTLYGDVATHPYWTKPISGRPTATMGDCMDQSRFGSMSTTTHEKLTVGTARTTPARPLSGTPLANGACRASSISWGTKC